jgi:hypothetical protein
MKSTLLFVLLAISLCQAYFIKSISKEEQENSLKYWTPERMKNAKSFEKLGSTSKVVPTWKFKETPYKQLGRIFFKHSRFGDYYCTGTSIGNNAIITAAHCIFNDNFAFNWIFIPQYGCSSRNEPKGRWTPKEFLIFDEWKDETKQHGGRDVGFAILEKNNDFSIEKTVGRLEISKCKVGEDILSIGYHRLSIDVSLEETKAKIEKELSPSLWKPAPLAIRSTQTKDSSGAPWISIKNGKPTVCSVNSFIIEMEDGLPLIYGSIFDQDVANLTRIAITK